MLVPLPVWAAALLSVSVGLAMAGVGFSVMHDANHGGTSPNARVNRVLSFTLDLMGASSFLWRFKHNVLHHAYPNLEGLDPDIEAGSPLLRLAPWQSRRWHHRFQHLYVWLLYGLFPLQWWFIDDVRELATGRIGGHQFPPARGRTLVVALAGKALFICWAFVLPAALHPSWSLLLCWGLAIFTLGNVLASVFQLAHCVGEAEFIGNRQVESDWAEHQVATTVDFARANALLGWYLGPGSLRRPAAVIGSATVASPRCAAHWPRTCAGSAPWGPLPARGAARSFGPSPRSALTPTRAPPRPRSAAFRRPRTRLRLPSPARHPRRGSRAPLAIRRRPYRSLRRRTSHNGPTARSPARASAAITALGTSPQGRSQSFTPPSKPETLSTRLTSGGRSIPTLEELPPPR